MCTEIRETRPPPRALTTPHTWHSSPNTAGWSPTAAPPAMDPSLAIVAPAGRDTGAGLCHRTRQRARDLDTWCLSYFKRLHSLEKLTSVVSEVVFKRSHWIFVKGTVTEYTSGRGESRHLTYARLDFFPWTENQVPRYDCYTPDC